MKTKELSKFIYWGLLIIGLYMAVVYAPIIWVSNPDFVSLDYTFVRVNAINVAIGISMFVSSIAMMYDKKWKWVPIIILILLMLWQILALLAYGL